MNKNISAFIDFVIKHPEINDKTRFRNEVKKQFKLTEDGKIFIGDGFAFRVCYTKNDSDSFGGTVLALSKLQKYDHLPFFTVLVKRNPDISNAIFLSNTSFLNKISHSSAKLTMDHICGSFLGSNIMRKCYGMENKPDNFPALIAIHGGFTAQENLERLVEATSEIDPRKKPYQPTAIEVKNIHNSVERAQKFVVSPDYTTLDADLRQRCEAVREAIIVASRIENVNIRGRLIEALITSDAEERSRLLGSLRNMEEQLPVYDIRNGLADYERSFPSADTYTDIKTKIIYLDSNPKAYNVDDFLRLMAQEKSVFLFFFVGIEADASLRMALCSVYDKRLMQPGATIFQHHWAGRATRGVAQFAGKYVMEIIDANPFVNDIDSELCDKFFANHFPDIQYGI